MSVFYKKSEQDREANKLLSRYQYFATGYVEDSFFTGLDILSIFTTPKFSGGLQSNFKVSSERKTSLKSCREKCVMVIHNHPLNVFYQELVSERQGAIGKLPQFKILENKIYQNGSGTGTKSKIRDYGNCKGRLVTEWLLLLNCSQSFHRRLQALSTNNGGF